MAEKTRQERPKHEAIVNAEENKQPEKSKLAKAVGVFLADDIDDVKDSIVDDYIKPRMKDFKKTTRQRIKEFIADTGDGILQALLFGRSGRKGYGSDGTYKGSRVNYVKFSKKYGYDYEGREEEELPFEPGTGFRSIPIQSFEKARMIKEVLMEDNARYPNVTVASYYELVGLNPSKSDYDWGWSKLDDIPIISTKKGYILDLPKPKPLG